MYKHLKVTLYVCLRGIVVYRNYTTVSGYVQKTNTKGFKDTID